jgi:putative transposase
VAYELRVIDPDYPYHAVSNGNNGGAIAFDRFDFANFVEELDRVATKYEWRVYSYVVLHTHHHLLLQTTKEAFSLGYQEMNGNHSRRTNRRHDRRDHLFRHRPFARPVLSDAHLVATVLYIARNPLAAGMVANAAAWPFGSYRALAGLEPAPTWLDVDYVLRLFGEDRAEAHRTFASLVHPEQALASNAGLWA